jgi:hypothetical protein
MLLRKTKLEYLKGHLVVCSTYLLWLQQIISESSGEKFTDKFNDRLNLSNQNWELLRQQVLALISHLSLGLDYYGNQPNYVPILRYEFYKDLVEKLLPIVGDIEKAYKNYRAAVDNMDNQVDALKDSLAQAKKLAVQMRDKITETEQTITATSDFIDEKTNELISYKSLLEQADIGFQDAVKAENDKGKGGCDFKETLQAASAIAAIWYPPAGAVGVALEVFNSGANADKHLGGLMQGVANTLGVPTARVLTRAIVVGQAVISVAEAYQKIKGVLHDNSDQAKVIVELKNYEEELKPYLHLEAARKYKQVISNYLNIIETRNKAIVDLNGLLADHIKQQAALNDLNNQITDLERKLSAKIDPSLVTYKNFVSDMYLRAKEQLLKVLYQEQRAFAYSSLSDPMIDIDSTQDVIFFQDFHKNVLISELDRLNQKTSPGQRIKNLSITLKKSDQPELFSEFLQTKKLNFTIRNDTPEVLNLKYREIKVFGVDVDIKGIKDKQGCLNIKLTQSGSSEFQKTNKERIYFTHLKRTIGILKQLKGSDCPITDLEENITEKDKFVHLGLLGSWVLEIASNVDLSKITEVKLIFTAFGIPM